MLRENPQLRPNIYQVVREVCTMRGKEVPIKDVCLIDAVRPKSALILSRSTPTVPGPKPEATNSCRHLSQAYLQRQSLAFKRSRKCNRRRASSQTSRQCDEADQQHPANEPICLPKELLQGHEGPALILLAHLTPMI